MTEENKQEQTRPTHTRKVTIIDGGSGDRDAVILDGGGPSL